MVNLKQLVLGLTLGCLFQISVAQSTSDKFIKIQELENIQEFKYTPNGMRLLLVQDNSAPVVTVQIVYSVGSKHEVPGNTGSTHLLEHLNFKGTPTFNKKAGTDITKLLSAHGAQMNATTWNDRTNYYETIPSDQIELALHVEADRMRNSLLLEEDKEAEMTVVRNEFERGENNPSSLLNKEIWATAYMAHPYHHSTIGWRSDIENMPIEVLREFYNTYYWPDNATLTIIGDFQKDNLFSLVDKYFGKITKAPHQLPQPYTTEPDQLGPRQITIKKPGQFSMVSKAFKIPGRMHADLPALQVLSEILGSGESSVISKTFVDTGLATYGYADATNFQEVGLFSIALGFSPDKDIESLNDQLGQMIEKVKTDGVSQEDVDRVVSKLNTQTILYRDGSGSIAGALTEAIAGGDWTDYIKGSERLEQVTADDVKRVANTYLLENQSTTGYFIPEQVSSSANNETKSSNFLPIEDTKYYYRSPEGDKSLGESNWNLSDINFSNITSDYENMISPPSSDNFEREKIVGIDVVTVKTGAKGFVTAMASFPIGNFFNSENNEMIPSLTVNMLSKGTKNFDKFELSQKLEKLGSNIRISSDNNNVTVRFKCLTKDLDALILLMAEELRRPLFDIKEFELLKQQTIDGMKRGLTDPRTQGSIALSQAIYPKNHPNYISDIESTIEKIKNVSLQDLQEFHTKYFGTAGMHLVVVGDINIKALKSPLKKHLSQWNSGITSKATRIEPTENKAVTKVVTIPQKPSAELFIGIYTGIERNDKDYLPLFLGTSVLGGGFSGRLMQTVRDNEGLTYSIYSRHEGHNNTGGYWNVNASFNPDLFERGLESTMVQVETWINDGITPAELTFIKNNIIGSFKVGMATTSGLASTMLSFLERGLNPDYLDKFFKDVEAVTVEEVNSSIKKYIDLDKLIIVKSGSLDQDGKPLK